MSKIVYWHSLHVHQTEKSYILPSFFLNIQYLLIYDTIIQLEFINFDIDLLYILNYFNIM